MNRLLFSIVIPILANRAAPYLNGRTLTSHSEDLGFVLSSRPSFEIFSWIRSSHNANAGMLHSTRQGRFLHFSLVLLNIQCKVVSQLYQMFAKNWVKVSRLQKQICPINHDAQRKANKIPQHKLLQQTIQKHI